MIEEKKRARTQEKMMASTFINNKNCLLLLLLAGTIAGGSAFEKCCGPACAGCCNQEGKFCPANGLYNISGGGKRILPGVGGRGGGSCCGGCCGGGRCHTTRVKQPIQRPKPKNPQIVQLHWARTAAQHSTSASDRRKLALKCVPSEPGGERC